MALGANCSPAPISPNSGAFSTTWTRQLRRLNASAVVSPPMPPPTMRIERSAMVTFDCVWQGDKSREKRWPHRVALDRA